MIKIHHFRALWPILIVAASVRLGAQTNYTPYSITTFAGNVENSGLVNGQGTAAQFASPGAVAVDASGNVYVADTLNGAIREISASGAVTTLAGSPTGAYGERDGTGAGALFGPVQGIVVDTSGNLYVSDWINPSGGGGAIRKITAGGVVTTVVSNGLNNPQGLALDASGNLYVADSGNAVIRKITSGGAMTVYAGTLGKSGSVDGAPGIGQLGYPTGVAFDLSGNLYVTDSAFNDIRIVASNGGLSTPDSASQGLPGEADGPLLNAAFSHPSGLTSDSSGNFYLVDNGTAIREIAAGGTVSTLAGLPGRPGSTDGAGQNALFNNATGIAVASGGGIYVADAGNNSIRAGVSIANQPPTIQFQPAPETVDNGSMGTPLMVTVSGSNVTYQWYLNGAAIPGATSATYMLTGVTATQGGTYTVTATNSFGSVTSNPVVLTVQTLARILNLSTRDNSGSGANALSAGFVLEGAGTTPKQMLIRGIGPALSAFGLSSLLAAPQLTLYDQNQTVIATNAGWNNDPQLTQAFINTGAFQLPANSLDSALLRALEPGLFTASVQGLGSSTGMALVEIYDDDLANDSAQLINISSRANITAASSLTAGFVLQGNSSVTLVVRGVGPGLAAFGLQEVVNRTTLTIYDGSSNPIYTNTGWGGGSDLAAAFTRVGAFPLAAGDSALLVTLPPGNYSAAVSSTDGSPGVGLVEVYELK